MQQANQTTLFVVSGTKQLLGALTDGDIRRAILKSGSIQGTVAATCKKSPVYITQPFQKETARDMIRTHEIEHLPVVDHKMCVLDVLSRKDLVSNKDSSLLKLPVVIMAGGRGLRLEPFTKILPKPLMPVGNKPILEIIMDKFHKHGVHDFYLTVNYKADMIRSYFDSSQVPYRINYVQENEFLGTAGSLRLLPDDFPDTFMISNCDITVDTDYKNAVEFHEKGHFSLTLIGAFHHFQVPYGIVDFSDQGAVRSIREKPTFDYTINTGVYIAHKDILGYIPERTTFHMTDLIKVLIKKRKRVGIFHVSEESFIDIGEWGEYKKNMNKILSVIGD